MQELIPILLVFQVIIPELCKFDKLAFTQASEIPSLSGAINTEDLYTNECGILF